MRPLLDQGQPTTISNPNESCLNSTSPLKDSVPNTAVMSNPNIQSYHGQSLNDVTLKHIESDSMITETPTYPVKIMDITAKTTTTTTNTTENKDHSSNYRTIPFYDDLSSSRLQNMCLQEGLSSKGSREEMIERHRSFIDLLNENYILKKCNYINYLFRFTRRDISATIKMI